MGSYHLGILSYVHASCCTAQRRASSLIKGLRISDAPPTLTQLKENCDGDAKSFPDHVQNLNLAASERHCDFIRETIRLYNMV